MYLFEPLEWGEGGGDWLSLIDLIVPEEKVEELIVRDSIE